MLHNHLKMYKDDACSLNTQFKRHQSDKGHSYGIWVSWKITMPLQSINKTRYSCLSIFTIVHSPVLVGSCGLQLCGYCFYQSGVVEYRTLSYIPTYNSIVECFNLLSAYVMTH